MEWTYRGGGVETNDLEKWGGGGGSILVKSATSGSTNAKGFDHYQACQE